MGLERGNGNGEWSRMGNGEWSRMGNAEWGMGNYKEPGLVDDRSRRPFSPLITPRLHYSITRPAALRSPPTPLGPFQLALEKLERADAVDRVRAVEVLDRRPLGDLQIDVQQP